MASDNDNRNRALVPILVLALGALNGWIAWSVHAIAAEVSTNGASLMHTQRSDATYHERIDALQRAQTLQARLLRQVRIDVQRHDDEIHAISARRKP